jgi:hypothetical protein
MVLKIGPATAEARTMTPRHIQLRRTKGWRLPPGAVVVARPHRRAIPFTLLEHTPAEAIALYRRHLAEHPELVEAAHCELAGKDLACWCRPARSATPTCCSRWLTDEESDQKDVRLSQ